MISVIMTTYNVEKYVNKAIDSILNQSYENFELIIIDDNSSDSTIKKITSYNDPRIKLYQNTVNAGTYFCKNFGITKSRGKYIAIHDSDDWSSPVRLEKQLKVFAEVPEAKIVKCQYVRVNHQGKILTEPKAAFQASMVKREVYDEIGYYDTVRVAGDDEFDCRAKIYYGREKVLILPKLYYYNLLRSNSLTSTISIGGEERTSYVHNFKEWHSKNELNKEGLFIPFPHVNRFFQVHENIEVKNKDLYEGRFNKIKTNGENVTATVVSFPIREEQFKLVVKDILPQVDKLQVYLNNYDSIPSFLVNDKITVFLGVDAAGDIADNGKIYEIDKFYGFHFTIDDDIKYPSDYVSVLKESLELNCYKCIVGVHGSDILYDQFEHYYQEKSRRVYGYNKSLRENREVNILGTGTVAYHTSDFRPDFSEVNKVFMLDIFFAIQANRKKLPLICIKRNADWLTDYETEKESRIYQGFKTNDKDQTKLIIDFPLRKLIQIDFPLTAQKTIKKHELALQKMKEKLFYNSSELHLLRATVKKYEDVCNSWSWKVTAPLRWIGKLFLN